MIVNQDIKDIGWTTHDDSTMGANQGGSGGGMNTMSIGNALPVQNLDNVNQKETPEEEITPKEEIIQEETKETQGEQEQKIDNINRNIEKWNEFLNNRNFNWANFIERLNNKEAKQFEEWIKNNDIELNKNANKNKDTINNFISYLMSNYKNEIYEVKTDPEYDNRTDQQRRDDTTIQRASEDYIKAGLNPKALSGYAGGGGGGGGSSGSKTDEEEEKRKKRRRELEEIRRAKHAEKMREKELITGIVQSLTNTATKAVGAGAFMGHQKTMQKSGNQHSMELEQYKQQGHDRRAAAHDQMRYDLELEKWLRSRKK